MIGGRDHDSEDRTSAILLQVQDDLLPADQGLPLLQEGGQVDASSPLAPGVAAGLAADVAGTPAAQDVGEPAAAPTEPALGSVEAVTCHLDWSPYTCAQINRVWGCESGYDASGRLDGWWAVGGGSNYGIAQLNVIHETAWPDFFSVSDMRGAGEARPSWAWPEWNIARAHELFMADGLAPWACAWATGE